MKLHTQTTSKTGFSAVPKRHNLTISNPLALTQNQLLKLLEYSKNMQKNGAKKPYFVAFFNYCLTLEKYAQTPSKGALREKNKNYSYLYFSLN